MGSARSSGVTFSSAASGTNWRAMGSFAIGSVDQRRHGGADGDGIALGDGLDPGEILGRDEAGLDELGGRAEGADRVQRPVSGTGAQITCSMREAPVASITSRSKPSAMPLASGICARAARKSSSKG